MLLFLCFQSLMNEVVHTSPTIGSNVEEIVVKNTHFLMWDIGGQESLRSSWNTYYSNTEVSNAREREARRQQRIVQQQQQVFLAAGVFVQRTDGGRGRPGQRSTLFFPTKGPV